MRAVGKFSVDACFQACGAAGPLRLEVVRGDGQEGLWSAVHQPFAVVGRDPAADVFLDDAAVSRRHLYLQVIDQRVFCVDLASRTGTHWPEGARPCGWVASPTGVRVGPFRLRPGADGGRGDAADPSPAGDWNPL